MKKNIIFFPIIVMLLISISITGCKKSSNVDNDLNDNEETLEDWQIKIMKLTGVDSVESITLAECAEGMEAKLEECSQKEGWVVDNQMSITEFETNQNYEIQDVRQGGCPGPKDKEDLRPFTVDSKYLDTQSERKATSFQIVCKIACYSWPCETTTPTPTTTTPPVIETPKEEMHTLTVKKEGTGSGTVSGSTLDCGDSCTADFKEGESVALNFESDKGSIFLGWSGACTGATRSCYVDMDEGKEVTATFAKASVKFNSGTCNLLNVDNYGDHHWAVDVSGEAVGPEGIELAIVTQVSGYETPENKCDSWGDSELQTCARNPGEPETTGFTHVVSDMIDRQTFEDFGSNYLVAARLFYNNNFVTEEEIEFPCPR